MSDEEKTPRRSRGEDAIFYAPSRKCWQGDITVGWKPNGTRDRITVRGKTKTEVKNKLRDKHKELDAGVRTPANYTIEQCIEDWLASLTSQSEKTRENYRMMAAHIIRLLGRKKIAELKAMEVQAALTKLAKTHSTRTVKLCRMVLVRSIRQAQINDLAVRNVAELIETPTGQAGRRSSAFTLEQSITLLQTARSYRLWPYVALSLLGGVRTEEARALHWSEVDLAEGTVAVYRAERVTGDTKTEKSRRVLETPEIAVQALRDLILKQSADRQKAGKAWQENDLVFCTSIGTPLDAHNVLRSFKRITKAAGLGTDWTPRELRHTFVSLLSDSGVSIEQIADAVGHSSSRTTESVYRHQIRPVLRTAAVVLDPLFIKSAS